MPNENLEQTADRLQEGAQTTWTSFGPKLVGTGTNVQEFQSITADAQTLAKIGADALETITKLREDEFMPEQERARRIQRIEQQAELLMTDVRKGIHSRLDKLESALGEAFKPAPITDSTKSILLRQELDMQAVLPPSSPEHPSNRTMLATLTELAASNADYASTILGPYGAAKMVQAGERAAIPALIKNVTLTLAQLPGGDAKQVAAKTALAAFGQVRGQVDGWFYAGKMRLDASKPVPGRSSVTAPDSIAPPRTAPTVTSSDLKSRARFKSR